MNNFLISESENTLLIFHSNQKGYFKNKLLFYLNVTEK